MLASAASARLKKEKQHEVYSMRERSVSRLAWTAAEDVRKRSVQACGARGRPRRRSAALLRLRQAARPRARKMAEDMLSSLSAGCNRSGGARLEEDRLREARGMIRQPCSNCGVETKSKKECPACGTSVVYVPRPKPPLERDIKASIRKALIDAGCMCMVHNVDNRQMSTGLGKGVGDLICIVPPFGRFLSIEVKRPKLGKVSPAQECFVAAVRKFGGVAGIATDVASALALVDEARGSV